MSEHGGPYPPSGQGQPGQGQGWPTGGQGGGLPPGPPPGSQGWQPGPPPAGPQGWQQPGPPTGPQGWQQPGPPTGPQGWQQPGPPAGPQGWQQPGQPTGPQGWQQPAPTQTFSGPGGQGQPWPGQQGAAPPPPAKNNKPIIITAIAVVVALVAAAGIYFFAIRDTNQVASTGAKSPQESVTALFTTLGNSDPIGLADQLDPVEAKLFTDLNSDLITELKRLGVLSEAASADSMTGTSISVSGLTFAGADESINDNLHIVQLTGGTITIASDPTKIPLGDKIKNAFGTEIDQAQPQSQTVNIADAVAENGGQPIRVATVKRGDQWYVSLFYTIADNAVHQAGLPNPTVADRIPDEGKDTPELAVQAFVDAASTGSIENVIKVLSPDEMGVLHDYGKLLIDQAGTGDLTSGMSDLGVTISNPTWVVGDVTGGKKVSIESLTITAGGQTAAITRDPDAGSVTLAAPGQDPIVLDENSIDSFLSDSVGSDQLTPELLKIIKQEFKQIIGIGIVTVQVDGKWYVSPIRSFSDIFVSLLKGLDSGDVDYLISLAQN